MKYILIIISIIVISLIVPVHATTAYNPPVISQVKPVLPTTIPINPTTQPIQPIKPIILPTPKQIVQSVKTNITQNVIKPQAQTITQVKSNNIINPAYQTGKTTKFHTINILRSEICNTLEKNNIKSDCPKMSDLIKYDTSNQHISGKFIPGPNGDLIRTKPQVKNNWLFYTSNIVCVDCVSDYFRPDTVKTIIIEPHNFVYVNKTEVSSNHQFTTFLNRIYQGCNSATISFDPKLINDTINYFKSECTTKIDKGNSTGPLPNRPFNVSDSIQWNYNQYLLKIKHESLQNCINYNCNIKSYGNKFYS